MNITIWGFALGMLLLILPLYIIYHFQLGVMHRFLSSFGRMSIGVVVMALILYGAIRLDSIVYDIVMLILLSLLSSVLALRKSRLKVSRLLIPLGISTLVAVAFVSFYMLFLVFEEDNIFLANLFMPVVGLVAGGMLEADIKALRTYYSGLQYHGQLYNYLIGNGGTHRQAIKYFVRRSLQSAIITVARNMSRVVCVSSPVLLFSVVMCGGSVLTAVAFQLLFYVSTLAASLISLFLAVQIGRRYSFDEYERLRKL